MSSYDLFKANEDGCENNLVDNKCLHETLTRIVRLMVEFKMFVASQV